MKTRPCNRIAAAILTVILALPLASLCAGDTGQHQRELIVSFEEMFTGDTTIDGDSTLTGFFTGAGTRHEDFTATQVGKLVYVTGTVTITTDDGTLTSTFTGTTPVDKNPTFIEGPEMLTGGTGIYANAQGNGTFQATVDFETGQIVGTAKFLVRAP